MIRFLAVLLAIAAPALAAAQESRYPDLPSTPAPSRATRRVDYVNLRGGGSLPVYGKGFTDLDGTEVDYDDMVRAGSSARLEMGALFHTPHGVSLGGFVTVGGASHPGDEFETPLGTYDFESLDLLVATAGLRVLGTTGAGFTFEAFAGGGVMDIAALDADFTPVGLTTPVPVKVYKESLRGLGEGGVRFGFGGDGFAVQIGVTTGVAFGPDYEDQFVNDGRGNMIIVAQAEFGIQIGF